MDSLYSNKDDFMSMNHVKQLVILAAGKGSRIRTAGNELPKPLVDVGGLPLLKRSILTAKKAGVSKFVVVLGYEANRIIDALQEDEQLTPLDITWLFHERYDLKNGVSVLQAEDVIEGEFFLTMADHVVDPSIYRMLDDHDMPGDLLLAVDYKLDQIFDMDDATKVKVSAQHHITEIDKSLVEFDAVDTGVFRCTPALFESLREHFNNHGDVSLSEGVKTLAQRQSAYVTDITEAWWQDVDDLLTRDEAERLLFKSLTKNIDGPVSKHINRRFSKIITRLVMRYPVIPNHMTTLGLIIGLASALVTAMATLDTWWLLPLGGLLYQTSSMIDGCDGEIARLKFMHSDWGEWYDTISDDIINLSYQGAMGYALYRMSDQSIWLFLGLATVLIGAFISVRLYQRLLREDAGTHLAIEWSFEKDQSNLFQKICARCSFVARRDFYALLLMCFAFAGIPFMQFGLSLSFVTLLFLWGQWYKSELENQSKLTQTVKLSQVQTKGSKATGDWVRAS
jgi:1L-myo-inositol 1-phosphate cytidylyltransferase / CDP-L-myo-inositol myo-inositolphosphotransferase